MTIYYTYSCTNPEPLHQMGDCNIGIAAAISISQSCRMELQHPQPSPTPTQNGDCNINIAAVISPSVPNHPHAAMLKVSLAVTAETMMWPRQAFVPSQPLTAHTNSQHSYTNLRAILLRWMFKVCCVEHENS